MSPNIFTNHIKEYKPETNIFITHRNEDKHIAELLRINLDRWSSGNYHIFNSYVLEASPSIAKGLRDDLVKVLSKMVLSHGLMKRTY